MSIILNIISGLGVFLYGMNLLSISTKALAGEKLKNLIKKVTSNTFVAIGIGLVVTAIIQSSSITTVIVVGFANASLLGLKEAFGIVLGANIGTTVTGWLLVLKIGKYGLILTGFGAILYIFSKKERTKLFSSLIMGFGMIFLGLEFMKTGLNPLRDNEDFIRLFSLFNSKEYISILLSALLGAILTAILQSSSATVGITMVLLQKDIIIPEVAVALVIGENLGTTITAYLASLNGNKVAKQVSYIHIINKVLGMLIFLPFFYLYFDFLKAFIGISHPNTLVAGAHTIYNIILTIILLFFKGRIIEFVEKIKIKESIGTIKETNESFAIFARVEDNLDEMFRLNSENFEDVSRVLLDDFSKKSKFIEREELLDRLNEKNRMLLLRATLIKGSEGEFVERYKYLFLSEQFESFGDYFAGIGKAIDRHKLKELSQSERSKLKDMSKELSKKHQFVYKVVMKGEDIGLGSELNETDIDKNIIDEGRRLDNKEYINIYRKLHRIERHLSYIMTKCFLNGV